MTSGEILNEAWRAYQSLGTGHGPEYYEGAAVALASLASDLTDISSSPMVQWDDAYNAIMSPKMPTDSPGLRENLFH